MELAPQPAFVLHRRPYRDNSALVDVFTLNTGRIACVARGVFTSKKGRSALLQSLQPLHLAAVGKGGLLTISSVEAASPAILLSNQALFCAYYLNELLLYLLPEREPFPELFAYYGQALEHLAGQDIQSVLRAFELRLLHALGQSPSWNEDAYGAAIEPGERYIWPGEGRLVPGQGKESISGNTVLGLSALLDGNAELNTTERREAKYLMRKMLDALLGGRVLNSRKFFEQGAASPGTVGKR